MSRLEELFAELREAIDTYETDIVNKLRERGEVQAKNDELIAAQIKLEDALSSATTHHKGQIEGFQSEIDALISEVHNLTKQVDELVSKKAALMQDNEALSVQNAEFRAYEAKAQKVLQATETSLLEREKAIQEREALKPLGRSLLPSQDK